VSSHLPISRGVTVLSWGCLGWVWSSRDKVSSLKIQDGKKWPIRLSSLEGEREPKSVAQWRQILRDGVKNQRVEETTTLWPEKLRGDHQECPT
jgi:hypothetical protein